MSTLREDVLPIVDDGRRLIDELGFRAETVVRRIESWDGSTEGPEPGTGSVDYDDLTITPSPKVVKHGEDLTVGPITPDFGTGGYTFEDLMPAAEEGTLLVYLVTGPNGTREYALQRIETQAPLRYVLHLTPLDRSVPY